MRQAIISRMFPTSINTPRYRSFPSLCDNGNTVAQGDHVWGKTGVFKNFHIQIYYLSAGANGHYAPHNCGVGKSFNFVIVKNGVDVHSITIRDLETEAFDETEIFVTAGDVLHLRQYPDPVGPPIYGGPAWFSMEFVADECCYSGNLIATTADRYGPVFQFNRNGGGGAATLRNMQQVVAAPGTFTSLRSHYTSATAGGTGRTIYLVKNGVVQDGTGGTVNTTTTLVGTNLNSAVTTFALHVAVGDFVCVKSVAVGAPSSTPKYTYSLTFTPDVDGQFNLAGIEEDGGEVWPADTAKYAATWFDEPIKGSLTSGAWVYDNTLWYPRIRPMTHEPLRLLRWVTHTRNLSTGALQAPASGHVIDVDTMVDGVIQNKFQLTLNNASTTVNVVEDELELIDNPNFCLYAHSNAIGDNLSGGWTFSAELFDLGEQEFIDGQVSHPLTWQELTTRDGVQEAYAEVDLNDAPGYYADSGYKPATVLRWDNIARQASDRAGQIVHMAFGATHSDTDRRFRTLLEDSVNRFLTNRPLVERMIDDEQRRIEGLPRLVANGYVSDYSPEPNLQFHLTGTDWLRKKFSRKRSQQQSWQPLIVAEDVPDDCPADVIGKAAPIVYGELTDQALTVRNVATDLPYDANISAPYVAVYEYGPGGGFSEAVGVLVAFIVGGVEGAPGTGGTGSLTAHDLHVFFSDHPTATHARVYWVDGGPFDPRGSFGTATRVRVKTIELGSVDDIPEWNSGAIPPGVAHGCILTGWTDGDDALTTSTSVDVGVGAYKPIYVGTETVSGTRYHKFLVARHAVKSIDELYVDDIAQRIQTDASQSGIGGVWLIPGYTGWNAVFAVPYEDVNDRRYAFIYGRVGAYGPDRGADIVSAPSTDGVVVSPTGMTINVSGVEDRGDGTGDLISRGVLQAKNFVNNWIAPDTPYQSGDYLEAADTTFPHIPTLTLVDDDSFDDVDAATEVRLGIASPAVGYEGAGIIGENGLTISAPDALARFAVSYDFDWFFDRKGRLAVSIEPLEADETVDAIDDVISIVEDSFRIQDRVGSEFFNVHPFVHTKDFAGRTTIGWRVSDEVSDEDSVENYDQERESPRWDLHFLRNTTVIGLQTVTDVMARKLARYRHPLRTVVFRVPLSGTSRELGQQAPIAHTEGIGAAGWEGRHVRFTGHELDPNDNTVVLSGYDLDTIWSGGSP